MSNTEDSGVPTTMPERLEYIRNKVGERSVRSFWQRLREEGETASYEAARTWHSSRQASPQYLARVADRFGANLHWLISGVGQPFEVDEQAALPHRDVLAAIGGAVTEGILDAAPHLRRLPDRLQASVVSTTLELGAVWPLVPNQIPLERTWKIAEQLGQLLLQPFDLLPFEPAYLDSDGPAFNDPNFERYVEAMLLAVNLAALVEPVRQGEAAD